MISIKYDADAKHDFKHPHCKIDWKDTHTLEVEYAMAVLLETILNNDKETDIEKVLKEVETIRNEIAKLRKEK